MDYWSRGVVDLFRTYGTNNFLGFSYYKHLVPIGTIKLKYILESLYLIS
jgi:hypothetical protein